MLAQVHFSEGIQFASWFGESWMASGKEVYTKKECFRYSGRPCTRQCNSMVTGLPTGGFELYCTVERHRFWPWLNVQIMWILMLKGFEREDIIIKKYLISKGRPVTHWKGALVLNFSMRKQNWVTHVLIVTRYQRRGNREYIVLFHVHAFLANYFFLCRKSEDFRLISLKVFRKFWATLKLEQMLIN